MDYRAENSLRKPTCAALLGVAWLAIAGVSGAVAGEAFVVTTSFEISGATSRVDLDPTHATVLDEYTVHSDAVVRYEGGFVYVLNRLFADNVLVLDAADGYAVVGQYSVSGVGTNPRDLVRQNAATAYVSLYESNLLWVGNPSTGAVQTTVDLSPFATDADGLIEADQMERVGNRLFVALQALDRNAGWTTTGMSALAVVDMNDQQLVDADSETPGSDPVVLQYQNPFWEMRYDPQRRRLIVLCSGRFLELDGALEIVNPFSLRSEGALVTEAQLGGDLLDFALVDAQTGYALIEKPNFDTCLVRFDAATGTLLSTVYCSAGFQLQDLELARDGQLVLGDRTPSAPGLRFFDAVTGAALAGPIDVGLPPFDLVLIEGVVTATAPEEIVEPALRVHPNPALAGQALSLRGEAGLAVAIYDARGRLVRRLAGPDALSFDGRDADGRPLAGGTYYLRSLSGRGGTTKLTLLPR